MRPVRARAAPAPTREPWATMPVLLQIPVRARGTAIVRRQGGAIPPPPRALQSLRTDADRIAIARAHNGATSPRRPAWADPPLAAFSTTTAPHRRNGATPRPVL